MGIGPTVGRTLLDVAGQGLEKVAKPFGFSVGREALAENLKTSSKGALESLVAAYRRVGESGRSYLNRMGEGGKMLARTIDESDEAAKLRAARDAERLDKILDGFGEQDIYHIADIVEAKVAAKSDRHLQAARAWDAIMQEYSDDAMDLDIQEMVGSVYEKVYRQALDQPVVDPTTGAVRKRTHAEAAAMATRAGQRPFTPRENYLPRYWSESSIRAFLKDPVLVDKALDAIVRQGTADTKEEAMVVLQRHLRQPAEFRGGALQHSRELDFIEAGYEKDLRKIGARYFYTAAKRLEVARRVGADDKGASQLIHQIAAEGGDANVANNLWLAFSDSADPKFRDLARLTSTIHGITLLSTAGIVQPSQIANVVARVGWTKTVEAMALTIKDWKRSKQLAEHMGATLDSIKADLTIDSPSGLQSLWSRIIGLEQLDRYNRVVSALSGRIYAADLAKKLAGGKLKGYALSRTLRELDKLGMDADAVFRQGGVLNAEQLRKAGYRMAKDTQFATSVLDMPEFRTTPAGRFTYLFKSFAFQQARFIKDHLIKEGTQHGNWSPLFHYVATAGMFGSFMGPVVRGLKGRKEPDSLELRTIEDMALAGTFGMYFDAARAIYNGPSSVTNWMLGPTFSEGMQIATSDVAGIARGIYREGEPDFEPMKKHLVKRVPGIGQAISSAWWPD